MFRSRTGSLRLRMTLSFSMAFGLLVFVGCTAMIVWSSYVAERQARGLVTEAARLFVHEWDWEGHDIDRAFREVADDERLAVVSLMVLDSEGRIIAANHPPLPPLPDQNDHRWLTTSISFSGMTVIAGENWVTTQQVLSGQAFLLLSLGAIIIAVAGAWTWVVVGWTLRPIGALSEQALAATANPLRVELVPSSTDAEVRQLVGTLNGMLHRLREDTHAKEQFYTAAAHELRTPLAVLSGSIEVTLSRSHRPEEYEETLHDLLIQTRRLISLTESLLLLNRLELGTSGEAAESIDVADVCERMLSALHCHAQQRGLQVTVDLRENAIVDAPPTQLSMLIRNLIENAMRYTTEQGRVVVSLTNEADRHSLRIYNDCQLPASLELDRLFVPFYRGDASRNTATGGNGLGLSICKAVADANGWEISLQREAQGLSATVRFGEPSA